MSKMTPEEIEAGYRAFSENDRLAREVMTIPKHEPVTSVGVSAQYIKGRWDIHADEIAREVVEGRMRKGTQAAIEQLWAMSDAKYSEGHKRG